MSWERHHIEIKESVLSVLCKPAFIIPAKKAILYSRKHIEKVIAEHPEFLTSHHPVEFQQYSSSIIEKMCMESKRVNVGPMAAVAGLVAEQCLESIINAGAQEAVIDNGGDIALYINKPLNVGIYAGEQFPLSLAFRLHPRKEPMGICTSSGTVGHSFSYGKADAAIVISKNIVLADVTATALANRIQSPEDLSSCFEILEELPEIEGSMIILGDKISLWGNLPEIIQSEESKELITRGRNSTEAD